MILAYYLWRFVSWLVAYLPPAIIDALARGGGASVYYIWPARRRIARENFAHVLGRPANDPAVGRVARLSFSNYCRYLVDVMRYPSIPVEQLEQRVVIQETDEFRRAMTGKTPIIMISAHFGNMDYASAVATRRYGRFTLAAETIHPVQLFQYLARVRSERGVDLIPYDRAPRKILEAIKRKEWIGFLIDFGVNDQKDIVNTEVLFFGAPTRFPASPAILAQRTGAPILVCHTCIDKDRINCTIEPPIYVPKELPREEAARITMQQVAHHMEKFIRAHPEQWYMFRAMWPTPMQVDMGGTLSGTVGSRAEV